MHTHLGGDLGVRGVVGRSEHDPRADHVAMRRLRRPGSGVQNGLVQRLRAMMNGLRMAIHPLSSAPGPIAAATRRGHPHRTRRLGHDRQMPKIPDSTKASLHQRLIDRSRERWPQLSQIHTRYRAGFAYSMASCPTARCSGCAGCATPARHENGALRSTEPATTTTKTRSCPPDLWAAHPKTPSTPPAASTSQTPLPGPKPPTNLRP